MRILEINSSDDTDVIVIAENVTSVQQVKDGGCVISFVGGGQVKTTASYEEVSNAIKQLAGGMVS